MDKGQAVFRTYTTLGRCISALPDSVALGMGRVAGDVMFHVRRDQRAVVTANLQRVLGPDAGDPSDLDRWARRSFREYARYWVEGARLPSTSSEDVARLVALDGLDHLYAGLAQGKGVIMALPHVGSWEYGAAFLATKGIHMKSVAERIEPPALFDYFVEQRAAMGLNIVPLDRHAGGLLLSALRARKGMLTMWQAMSPRAPVPKSYQPRHLKS